MIWIVIKFPEIALYQFLSLKWFCPSGSKRIGSVYGCYGKWILKCHQIRNTIFDKVQQNKNHFEAFTTKSMVLV